MTHIQPSQEALDFDLEHSRSSPVPLNLAAMSPVLTSSPPGLGESKSSWKRCFLGDKMGRGGIGRRGAEGRGFCKAAAGAGGAGTQRWRVGEAGSGLRGSGCCSCVVRWDFGGSRLRAGVGHRLGGGFLCATPAWVWVTVGRYVPRDPSREPEKGRKRKVPPKHYFVRVWGACVGTGTPLCVLLLPSPGSTTEPSGNTAQKGSDGQGKVLGALGAQGAQGAQGAGCSGCWVLRVQDARGAGCSGQQVLLTAGCSRCHVSGC